MNEGFIASIQCDHRRLLRNLKRHKKERERKRSQKYWTGNPMTPALGQDKPLRIYARS